jgi:hypothetical protein
MYIKVTPKDFKDLKKNLPDDMNLWLTEETFLGTLMAGKERVIIDTFD